MTNRLQCTVVPEFSVGPDNYTRQREDRIRFEQWHDLRTGELLMGYVRHNAEHHDPGDEDRR